MLERKDLSLKEPRSITQNRWLVRTALLALLLLPSLMLVSSMRAQQAPKGSAASSLVKPAPAARSDLADKQGLATPSPSAEPETIWTREELAGDWGGTRKKWEEHGVKF